MALDNEEGKPMKSSKWYTRLMALALSIIMVVGLAPLTASAEEGIPYIRWQSMNYNNNALYGGAPAPFHEYILVGDTLELSVVIYHEIGPGFDDVSTPYGWNIGLLNTDGHVSASASVLTPGVDGKQMLTVNSDDVGKTIIVSYDGASGNCGQRFCVVDYYVAPKYEKPAGWEWSQIPKGSSLQLSYLVYGGVPGTVVDAFSGTKSWSVSAATTTAVTDSFITPEGLLTVGLDETAPAFYVTLSLPGEIFGGFSLVFSVIEPPSSDATLSALTLSTGSLTPAFDPEKTSYTVTVPNSVTSISIGATANDAAASVTGAGTKTLDAGASLFPIEVNAEDGTTKTYTITVNRLAAEEKLDEAYAVIIIFANLWETDRVVTITENEISWTPDDPVVETPAMGMSMFLPPIAVSVVFYDKNDQVIWQAGGIGDETQGPCIMQPFTFPYSLGDLTFSDYSYLSLATIPPEITCSGDPYPITISITRGQLESNIEILGNTHTVTLTFALKGSDKSSDATLSALTVSTGTLAPAFDPDTTSYTMTVPNATASIDISATANHAAASVSGTGTKTLAVGANPFSIVVTAEDESTKTYTVTVTREAASPVTPDPEEYPATKHFGTWEGTGGATASTDAEYARFVRLLLNDEVVDPGNYTVTEGSTIITLAEAYLATLANGTYTFVAEFTDGFASFNLTVTVQPNTGENTGPGSGSGSPQTGDGNGVAGLMALLAATILGFISLTAWRRRLQLQVGNRK